MTSETFSKKKTWLAKILTKLSSKKRNSNQLINSFLTLSSREILNHFLEPTSSIKKYSASAQSAIRSSQKDLKLVSTATGSRLDFNLKSRGNAQRTF